MPKRRRTKADVKSKKIFSWGNKTKSGKEAKSGVTVTFKDGTETTLLNPSGKATKYAFELGTNTRVTNAGVFKTDDNGNELSLSKEQRAYRSGYLDSQKDNAKAYKAKRTKRTTSKK